MPIQIDTASVRVMRSYDYSHFEICLTSSEANTPEQVNELRKEANRLADKAVDQFIQAKKACTLREEMRRKWLLDAALARPENERTPKAKAIIKYHSDADFAAQFDYDYQDDWQERDFED